MNTDVYDEDLAGRLDAARSYYNIPVGQDVLVELANRGLDEELLVALHGLAFTFEFDGLEYGCIASTPFSLGDNIKLVGNDGMEHCISVMLWTDDDMLDADAVGEFKPDPHDWRIYVPGFHVPAWYKHTPIPRPGKLSRFTFEGTVYTIKTDEYKPGCVVRLPNGTLLRRKQMKTRTLKFEFQPVLFAFPRKTIHAEKLSDVLAVYGHKGHSS